MPYNLASPNGLIEPPSITNTVGWYLKETNQVTDDSVRAVLQLVGTDINHFVRWPERALLLWRGSDRIAEAGKSQKYHRYPGSIKQHAKKELFDLDTRPNGPAIASFCLAGGERPNRFGSANKWSIHHLYSGKFPFPGNEDTKHACKSKIHFTQSAGLVAAHPIADGLADEFPFFTWLLRLEAFSRFHYDPDGVFSEKQDDLGFAEGHDCEEFQVLD